MTGIMRVCCYTAGRIVGFDASVADADAEVSGQDLPVPSSPGRKAGDTLPRFHLSGSTC